MASNAASTAGTADHNGNGGGGDSSSSDNDATAQLERKISQAVDEGHDADIPSNAGYVLDERGERRRRQSITSRRKSAKKRRSSTDLEKGEKRRTTSTRGREGPREEGEKDGDEEAEDQSSGTEDDANAVWWDGPDDPANPYNWPGWKKGLNIGFVSAMTFVSPLASCK